MGLDKGKQNEQPLPVRLAAAGDEEAFAVIVQRMTPLIRTQVRRCRCVGVEDEDLAQEALLALLAAVRTFRPEGGAAFTSYATTCIYNRLVSVVRRSKPRLHHEQPLDDRPDWPAGDGSDPVLRLQDREDAARLLQQLRRRLTPLEYRVLITRLSDCSYQEAAAQLGVSTKTVDNAVQRLRHKLCTPFSFRQ